MHYWLTDEYCCILEYLDHYQIAPIFKVILLFLFSFTQAQQLSRACFLNVLWDCYVIKYHWTELKCIHISSTVMAICKVMEHRNRNENCSDFFFFWQFLKPFDNYTRTLRCFSYIHSMHLDITKYTIKFFIKWWNMKNKTVCKICKKKSVASYI